jgi:hypothetical protein
MYRPREILKTARSILILNCPIGMHIRFGVCSHLHFRNTFTTSDDKTYLLYSEAYKARAYPAVFESLVSKIVCENTFH